MNKKNLSERDICTKYITPAIQKAGWDLKRQVREEFSFTDGRIIVRGDKHARGKRKRADYILYYKPNIPLAIVEAKDNKHSIGSGMQQALEYAEILDIPFVFSSNGDRFLFHDKTKTRGYLETELNNDNFPTPSDLWNRYKSYKGIEDPDVENVIAEDYHFDDRGMIPRYYQQIAVNRTIEAIAKGQDRVLLVMATGTGKTYTAFQIIYRLWKAKRKSRILYLADRNVLISQAKNGDFKGFGQDIMTVVKHRKIDKSYQIYFALYQGLTGGEDWKNVYTQFSPDFFDMVVIDECHRGSASEASAWREILDYFKSATHFGMTATPKETKDVSNISYFGEPVYVYSLRQGIEDGFLAPYKVMRIALDVDDGYRPEYGKVDIYGVPIEDRIFNQKDYDRTLVIEQRTQQVAKRVTEFLRKTDRLAKTIVFCVDTEHANRMRSALVNENGDMVTQYPNYVVRITGDDEVGQRAIDDFKSIEERIPVIATTSKLLTTGVDTKTVKLIVLDANIQSMTEFKQIIGRGTRIEEEEGKVFFTIMDFRKATNHFADPDFDGPPIQSVDYDPNQPIEIEDLDANDEGDLEQIETDPREQVFIPSDNDERSGTTKYYINDVPVSVVNERVQYYGPDGTLITESLIDYTKKNIINEYRSLDVFLIKWNQAEKKKILIDELAENGILWEALKEEIKKDMDPFDLVCHIAFDQPPLTRRERALEVKKRNYFTKYGEQAQKILKALLDKYENEGVTSIESNQVLRLNPLNQMGTPVEIVQAFGKKDDFEKAIKELEDEIYKSA